MWGMLMNLTKAGREEEARNVLAFPVRYSMYMEWRA